MLARMKKLIGCLFTLALAISAFAQTDLTERQIVVIPQAEHPQIAKESGLGGRVTAYVTVDSAGNVVSVDNVTGPDWVCPSVARPDVLALREAARTAAEKAKFAPATGSYPTTSISLNFDFPANGRAVPYAGHTYQGSVTDAKPNSETTNPSPRFTIKGDRDYSAANAPPPDYTGPVYSASNTPPSPPPSYSGPAPKQISGGVLNGKAMSLPKPPYPPAARAVRASGPVSIQVLIDEDGQIFSAMAVSGHPLLRSAARDAACGAAFSPTLLMGNPVKVSGVITYNFVP